MGSDGYTVPEEFGRDGYVFFMRTPDEEKFLPRSERFATLEAIQEYLTPLRDWVRSHGLSTQRFVGEIIDGRLVRALPLEYLEWGGAWVKGYSIILPPGERICWELALPPVHSA